MGPTPLNPRRIRAEILIVLGLSLGMSALYATVSFWRRLADERELSQQTATLNRSLADEQIFDVIYQLLGIISGLVPVALVFYLVWSHTRPRLGAIGLDATRPTRDSAWGVGLAALIGLPGLALYIVGVNQGITVQIVPSALSDYWWTIPVLLLAAIKAGILEEVIAVGYLTHRLGQLGVAPWAIVAIQALLRGFYHLYQGIGPFFGNIAMGVVFALWFMKTKRLAPLIIAHALIDAVAFVGYPLIMGVFPDFLGFTQ
ncbi:CAAX protease [Pontimonas salivibrio]|uniref:CAAX protease n=1 Tax=Pontimonas salivibrio TaxID=1159327 RepID=A0A2L2BPH6_9MICO|nr:CPBP family intramembrane glutamic endopeptidase [Pontimonas salivibrio]AVG23547.1 CAAX protease [Pontimonas salivibrio]